MTNWILVAIICGLTANFGSFLARLILKNGEDASAYAWFHELFRFIFFLIVCFFSPRASLSGANVVMLLGLGIVEFISVYTVMKMHAHNQYSISTIILRTKLIWIPLITFVLFREQLRMTEYLGILVLFFGLAIVTSPKQIKTDKGLIFAYVSGFMTAWVAVFLQLTSHAATIPIALVFSALPSLFIFPVMMKSGVRRMKAIFLTNLPLKITTGLINAGSMYLLAYSLTLGPASKVIAISQSTMLVAVIAGIVFLGEKDRAVKKILGSIVSLIGVILLTGK